jgi:LysM repeat protein
MNTPNPLIPQGSRLEQQSNPRARVKLAVFFVLTIHVVGVLALLLQGCKRETPPEPNSYNQPDTAPVVPPFEPAVTQPADSNVGALTPDGGMQPTPPPFESYTAVAPPIQEPVATPPPTAIPEPPPSTGQTYKIKTGDTFYGLAGEFGVTMQAIVAANPNVDPNRLQIGQTINIPPRSTTASSVPSPASPSGETIYVVRSGDTLTKIADRFGTSVKAIRTANNLQTTVIRVGQKLTIPTAQAAPASAPGTPPPGGY